MMVPQISKLKLVTYVSDQFPYIARWQIYIDDRLLTTAHSFSKYDDIVCRYDEEEFFDGDIFADVRQAGQYVIWIPTLRHHHLPLVYVFDINEYNEIVDTSWELTLPPNQLRQSLPQSLPQWTTDCFQSVLPDWVLSEDDAIYRIPERSDDPDGKKLVFAIHQLIKNYGGISIAEIPQESLEIRIGFDSLFEFIEAIWFVGKTDTGGYALYFQDNPHFPLWLCGKSVDEAFKDETFFANE